MKKVRDAVEKKINVRERVDFAEALPSMRQVIRISPYRLKESEVHARGGQETLSVRTL